MPPRTLATAAALVLAAAVSVSPTPARGDVTLDAASLNELLAGMAPERVQVDLLGGRAVSIELHEMKVTGFDPAAGANGEILTSVRVKIPELGLDLPVNPRLSVQLKQDAGAARSCYLKFEKVMLALPLTGSVDVAPLLPVLPVMSEAAWMIDAARGKVRVKPSLIDARTGATNLRLGFDLAVTSAPDERASN
jgi:hypothetical protein